MVPKWRFCEPSVQSNESVSLGLIRWVCLPRLSPRTGIRRGPPFSRWSYGRVGGFFVRPQILPFLVNGGMVAAMDETAPETTNLVEVRNEKGQFLPGMRHGPGRIPGRKCGRARALATLDAMLEEEGTQAKLKAALRKSFDKDPVRFFKTIIMPLMPQNVKIEMQAEGQVVWRRIRDSFDLTPEGEVIDVQPEVVEEGEASEEEAGDDSI